MRRRSTPVPAGRVRACLARVLPSCHSSVCSTRTPRARARSVINSYRLPRYTKVRIYVRHADFCCQLSSPSPPVVEQQPPARLRACVRASRASEGLEARHGVVQKLGSPLFAPRNANLSLRQIVAACRLWRHDVTASLRTDTTRPPRARGTVGLGRASDACTYIP